MGGDLLTQEATQQSNEQVQKKFVRLTDEEEDAMAEGLEDNSVLHKKWKKDYYDGQEECTRGCRITSDGNM